MKITLHQLKVLAAVKQHGSITAAAHALHITQPAVSNILRQLEQGCSYPVTESIGKKVVLSKAGERLVVASDQVDAALESAMSDIAAMEGELSGTMRVAIVSTAKYFVPRLLGEFRKSNPAVQIKLTVCNRQAAVQILKDNACDFLVMSQPPKELAIDSKLFYEDQLLLVASPELEIGAAELQLRDLQDEDWIIREPGSGTRIVMQKLFKRHKMAPNIAMEVGNNESIKQMLMANMGISIVSRQSIELELQHQLIKILPVAGFPLHHPWYLVKNRGKRVSRVAEEFFAFVAQHETLPIGHA